MQSTKQLVYNQFLSNPKTAFSVSSLRARLPELSVTAFNWAIHSLAKSGDIARQARGVYKLAKPRPIAEPAEATGSLTISEPAVPSLTSLEIGSAVIALVEHLREQISLLLNEKSELLLTLAHCQEERDGLQSRLNALAQSQRSIPIKDLMRRA